MKRHFKENWHVGDDAGDMHRNLLGFAGTLAGNIMFAETHPAWMEDAECQLRYAQSAYHLIAVCEAAIASVPEDVAKEAKRVVAKCIRPLESLDDVNERVDALMDEFGSAAAKASADGGGVVEISGTVPADSEVGRVIRNLIETAMGGEGR